MGNSSLGICSHNGSKQASGVTPAADTAATDGHRKIINQSGTKNQQHRVHDSGHNQQITIVSTFFILLGLVGDGVPPPCAGCETRRSGSIDSKTGMNATPWKNFTDKIAFQSGRGEKND